MEQTRAISSFNSRGGPMEACLVLMSTDLSSVASPATLFYTMSMKPPNLSQWVLNWLVIHDKSSTSPQLVSSGGRPHPHQGSRSGDIIPGMGRRRYHAGWTSSPGILMRFTFAPRAPHLPALRPSFPGRYGSGTAASSLAWLFDRGMTGD